MPYIKQVDRPAIDAYVNQVAIAHEGDLNYAITQLVLRYLPANPRYADYNTVVGVLESAKLEFYRRAVAKYEDQKAFDNGDVYDKR